MSLIASRIGNLDVKAKRDNKEMNMNNKRMAIVIILMLGLLAAGCAQSTTSVSRNGTTKRTTMRLIFQPDFADRSFSSGEDYSLSTQFNDVTYIWPEGKGNFSKEANAISFEGKNINCTVVNRQLTINGRQVGEFKKGDSVRITADGEVFVNGVKLKQSGNT
jgi:hypothetical protein